jgi:hypothetical protein
MLLGMLIALSPWFPAQTSHELVGGDRGFVVLNTITVGVLVFGLALLEYVALQRWQEGCEILLGLWLIASPYIFGYFDDGLLRFWHSSLGGLVVLLATFQLWQDWDLPRPPRYWFANGIGGRARRNVVGNHGREAMSLLEFNR